MITNKFKPNHHALNDIFLTDDFWDCECTTNYIHPKDQPQCMLCSTLQIEQPNSRVDEVLKDYSNTLKFLSNRNQSLHDLYAYTADLITGFYSGEEKEEKIHELNNLMES